MYTSTDKIEQIEAMRLGVDYSFPIKVRGFEITLRPLSISEQMQVAAKVFDSFSRLPESAKNRISENVIHAKETLIMASTSDFGKNDPKITEYVLDRFTNDEVQCIWKQYIMECDRVSPVLDKMPDEEISILVDKLKKKPDSVSELSFLELTSVCRHLINGD